MAHNNVKSNGELPPFSESAEAACLGCVMSGVGDEPHLFLTRLNESHFYDERHLTIFRGLLELENDQRELSPSELHLLFNRTGRTKDGGGIEYYTQLPEKVASAAEFPTHFDVLEDRSQRRAMLKESGRLALQARDLTTLIGPDGKILQHDGLPDMIDAVEFSDQKIEEPQQVIHNVLYRGSKLAIGGGSKTFKTWNLLDLAFCVSHGLRWMKFQCSIGKVLYCNFEIQTFPWQKRLHTVAHSYDREIRPGMLTIWNLRGHSSPHNLIIPKIIDQIKGMDFSLVVFDPIYKMSGTGNENAAEDIGALLNSMERVAVECNCAVAFGHHHSKGNQSGKEAIDRMSGSGVFGRDPDAIIDLSKHQEEGCFSVEPILRNFAPVTPFVVRWEKPRMRVDDDLDPKDLKQPVGGPKKKPSAVLLRAIEGSSKENPVSISMWASKLAGVIGRTGLLNYLEDFRINGWIATVGDGPSARQYITEKGRSVIT